jgi:hypothetical protein
VDPQRSLFDQPAARRERDRGIARVMSTEEIWREGVKEIITARFNAMPIYTAFIGEDLRRHVLMTGALKPHHPNAWGGVIGGLTRGWLKEGRLRMEGFGQSASRRSHAHFYRRYVKIA